MSNILLEELRESLNIDPEVVSHNLEIFIREYTEKFEREGIVIGLSGGLDSAVVALLCKRALGTAKILALIMPDKDSKKEHLEDALQLVHELDIPFKLIDITTYLQKLGIYQIFPLDKIPVWGKLKEMVVKEAYRFYRRKTGRIPFHDSLLGFKGKEYHHFLKNCNAYYRIKHRLRMLLLYYYAELENRLVVGAANKSEYKIGFFVKFGCDNAADIMPLINLYKTQVRELAGYLNIPKRIIIKPPSPDIMPGLEDEQVLNISYEKMDLILLAMEKSWKIKDISEALKIEIEEVKRIRSYTKESEHMRRIYRP